MRHALKIALVGLGLALTAPSAASAAINGFATANVNFRSGPDIGFPAFAMIPYGAPVIIFGCLSDRSWCDVGWAGARGWVYAAYLDDGRGGYYPAPYPNPIFAAPIIGFDIELYWGDHYRDRPWYRDRDRYDYRKWRRDKKDDKKEDKKSWNDRDYDKRDGHDQQQTQSTQQNKDGVIYFDKKSGGTDDRDKKDCYDEKPNKDGFQPSKGCKQ